MSAHTGKMFRKRHPWYESWRCAWRRCTDPNHKSYGRYGGGGIKFLLTRGEASYLWWRDQAHLIEKPRLDRINVDKNYCVENYRFISDADNIARMQDNSAVSAEWVD